MSSWVKKCWIRKIILIDDEYDQDEFMKTILPMSAPAGTKVEIRSVSDALTILKSDISEESTLLLFRELKYAFDLYEKGFRFNELNIGNIGSAADRKPVTKKIYMSEAEKKMCRLLSDCGVYVYIQELPHDARIPVDNKV
jgi:mannose/fructose/N-acetylgalactosamine-specific phosphotransferase system component IIB